MLTSQAAARRGLLLGAVGCLAPVGLVAERDLAAVGQDIAALTLAGDLRDLRLAQRSCAYSPRLLGAVGTQPPHGSWLPLGEWCGRAERCASHD